MEKRGHNLSKTRQKNYEFQPTSRNDDLYPDIPSFKSIPKTFTENSEVVQKP